MNRVVGLLLVFLVTTSAEARSISIGDDHERNLSLGNGWRSDAEMKAGSCSEPGATITDGQVGRIDLSLDMNEGSTSEKLGLDIGGRARIGVINYSLSAQYNHEAMSRGFSIAYSYSAQLKRSKRIDNRSGSPVKARPGFDSAIKDGAAWKDLCGDEVVYMVDEGAMLLVNIRMDFTTREEKMRFQSRVGVSGPLFSADLGVDVASGEFNRNSKMTINLLQLGGDPAKLGQVFCPKEVDENGRLKDPNCMEKAAHIVSCNFGDLKSCMETIRQAVAYGNGQAPDQFGGQVTGFEKYATQKLYAQPWRELGGSIFPRAPSDESVIDAKANRSKLSELFEENYGNWIYANRMGQGKGPRLSPRQKEQMLILEAQFKSNMSVIAEAIDSCYDLPLHCKDSLAVVQKELGYADRSGRYVNESSIVAQTQPEIYAQICDLGMVGTSQDPLKKTVVALNTLAFNTLLHGETGSELDAVKKKWNEGDICSEAGKSLEGMSSIHLTSLGLSDLRPFEFLPQLEELDLSDNQISDLRPLGKLGRLKMLTLNKNQIADVSPLLTSVSLKELSLQRNPLQNVSILKGMGQLTFLDLSQNDRNVVCPLPETICQTSALSNETSFQLVRTQLDRRAGQIGVLLSDQRIVFNGGMNEQGAPISLSFIFTPGFWESPQTRDVPSSIGRVYHTVTKLLDGRILVAGGWYAQRTALDSWELYSPDFQFLRGGNLLTRRAGHTATLLPNGKVVFTGGWSGKDPSAGTQVASSFEVFDPVLLESTSFGEMRSPRVYHTATLLKDGSGVFLNGGYSSNESLKSSEILDVASLKTRLLKNAWMSDGRGMQTATLLADGKILVSGGFGKNSEAVGSVEIFDPATQNFLSGTNTGPKMKFARGAHSAALLSNGKVLMVGGRQKLNLNFWSEMRSCQTEIRGVQMNDCLRSAEVFDPQTGKIQQVSDMVYPRAHASLVLLPDYRALFIGGVGTEDSPNTSEVFEYSAWGN